VPLSGLKAASLLPAAPERLQMTGLGRIRPFRSHSETGCDE